MNDFLKIIKKYAEFLQSQTKTPVIIAPSEVKSERFHIELNLLSHPTILENERAQLRLRATVFAEIPSSDRAINDVLTKSLTLALFFSSAQGFYIEDKKNTKIYGMAYHTPLAQDDELFTDLAEERSYSYTENWLVKLEFNLKHFFD